MSRRASEQRYCRRNPHNQIGGNRHVAVLDVWYNVLNMRDRICEPAWGVVGVDQTDDGTICHPHTAIVCDNQGTAFELLIVDGRE